MNKNIFRSRTVIGAVCILLAVLVCFGITPLFNEGLKAQTEAVRVKAEVIPQGTYITADMVEVYTRGASGMEDSIATSLDEVVGRYTYVELRKNTDVNTAWLSSEPLTQYEYLTRLNGSKERSPSPSPPLPRAVPARWRRAILSCSLPPTRTPAKPPSPRS